jgi:hypothetical protein
MEYAPCITGHEHTDSAINFADIMGEQWICDCCGQVFANYQDLLDASAPLSAR